MHVVADVRAVIERARDEDRKSDEILRLVELELTDIHNTADKGYW